MSDYLEPVEGYFSSDSHAYFSRVRETLLADFSTTPLVGLLVLPSFELEYALWIGQDWRRCYAVYRVAKSSIWQALQDPLAAPVTFSTRNVELPVELARELATLFWAALGQTRYAQKSGIMLDGTAYYVTAFQAGSGFRNGKTQSPPASSRLRELLDLTQNLIQQIIDSSSRPPVRAELIEKAIALQTRFKDF